MSTAIVVEGGAMRGIFAAGVLDAFMEAKFEPFALALGSSAGACNLSSQLAGQYRRNWRCYSTQMRRPEFVDARRFVRGGHWLDLDYLWEAFAAEDPLDVEACARSATRLIVAATDVETGTATYFEPDAADLFEVLRASSAVPVLFRRFVEYRGRTYVDGGLTAPIPVEEAYRRGARKIMVLRSRPAAFPGPSRLECALAAASLRTHPAVARAFLAYRGVYERSRAFLARPPADCVVIHVAPQRHLRSSRTTRDPRRLAADYALGRAIAPAAIAAWHRDRSQTLLAAR